jgi:hypothetical protein
MINDASIKCTDIHFKMCVLNKHISSSDYVLEGVLKMKLEEFIRLKQGGDTVMQYLNKFNHLS